MWLTFGSPKDEAKAFIVFLLKEHCLLLNDVVTEATLESRGAGRRRRGRMDGDEGKRKRGGIREEASVASRENKSCCHANKATTPPTKKISLLNVESSHSASHYGVTLQQMAGGCETKALVH